MRYHAIAFCVGWMCVLLSGVQAGEIRVADSAQLQAAVAHLTPGTTVLLGPGVYQGGVYLSNVSGTQDAPVVIQGAEPNAPPVFRGDGGQAFHLADCSHIVLRNIRAEGFSGNGINIDDGGSFETPSHHVALEHVTIVEIGPRGNHDALKMSGVDHFQVRNCRHNTIVLPEKWVLRILQETEDPRFEPCHGGLFEDNLVFYDSRVQVFVNVGPRTAPETFGFRRNAWCDVEGSRTPSLPVEEQSGVYLSKVGAEAYIRIQ